MHSNICSVVVVALRQLLRGWGTLSTLKCNAAKSARYFFASIKPRPRRSHVYRTVWFSWPMPDAVAERLSFGCLWASWAYTSAEILGHCQGPRKLNVFMSYKCICPRPPVALVYKCELPDTTSFSSHRPSLPTRRSGARRQEETEAHEQTCAENRPAGVWSLAFLFSLVTLPTHKPTRIPHVAQAGQRACVATWGATLARGKGAGHHSKGSCWQLPRPSFRYEYVLMQLQYLSNQVF